MRIVRDYYTQSKKRLREAEQEEKRREAAMTPEERDEWNKKWRLGLLAGCERLREMSQTTRRVPNEKRLELFWRMAGRALTLARRIEADLLIEDSNLVGKIQMTTEYILFSRELVSDGRKLFLQLLQNADHAEMSASQDLFQIEFRFALYDRVSI